MFLSRLQLAPLDKIIALLQSVTMFYVAYPAAVATGKVLLQTAPPIESDNMSGLVSRLHEVSNYVCWNLGWYEKTKVTYVVCQLESHPLVVDIPPPHVWQLMPNSRLLTKQTARPGDVSSSSIIVATLSIHISPDATDNDILDITQLAREKCAPILGTGELTIEVTRSHPRHSPCPALLSATSPLSGSSPFSSSSSAHPPSQACDFYPRSNTFEHHNHDHGNGHGHSHDNHQHHNHSHGGHSHG
jgi:hypothetical protein